MKCFIILGRGNTPMTKPSLSVTQPDGSRKYVHPLTGEAVPSITTIIKAGLPQPWLGPWAAKMASEHLVANWERLSGESAWVRINEGKAAYKNYAEQRAYVGDVVHDLVDCWSIGRPYPDPPREVRLYIDRFIDFLTAKRPVFLENETTFWSRTYGYAGTGDFIVKIDGKTYLADLKSGKSLHPEVGLQTSALAHTDFILRPDGTEHELPDIDGIAALHLRPRGWKFVVLQESEKCFEAFLAAREVMEWTIEIAPNVLSLRLRPACLASTWYALMSDGKVIGRS